MTENTDMQNAAGQACTADDYLDLAALYRFFAGTLLYELTEEQIGILTGFEVPQEGLNAHEAEGYRWLATYLSHRGPDARRDLAVDYARVFLAAGVFEGDTAVPYESVYLGEEKILMQGPRDEVVKAYRAFGYGVREDLQIPEDHAGFELEFVALLAEQIAAGLNQGADVTDLLHAQSDFIEKHLLSWLPMLTERVDEFAQTRFYPALMRIVMGTLESNLTLNG